MAPGHDDIRMRGFAGRVSLAEAMAILRARIAPLPTERASVAAGSLPGLLGRCLAADVRSGVDLPRFRRAAMDGYAVRAAETSGASEYAPISLGLRGESQRAGAAPPGPLAPGEALRIMTGAAVPDGADAVVMAEYAREVEGRVELHEPVAASANAMPIGEDVRRGEVLLRAPHRLRPQDLGLLAGIGAGEIEVRPRVRVAIVPTGDELVPAGGTPAEGGVVDTNSPMLAALAALHGGIAVVRPLAPDRPEAVRAALGEAAAAADVVVVIGGTAVGEEDHVPRAVSDLGELLFHGVALRPASPTGAGLIARAGGAPVPIVLAPGSPVASMIAFDLFAGACLCLLEGRPPSLPYPRARGRLARKISSAPGRTDFVRVTLRDGLVEPLMTGGASILSSTTRADGLLVVPHDLEGFAAGADVDVLLYRSETIVAP